MELEDEEDFEEYEESRRPVKIKCKYCGHYFEMKEEVRIDPKTGEYVYVCPNCAKKLEKDVDRLRI